MREPKPFFKKSHQCWYFRQGGKDVRLDPDKKKAEEIYRQLRDSDPSQVHRKANNPTIPVWQLFDEFLEWVKANLAEQSYEIYRGFLDSFAAKYPALKVGDLRVFHVTKWCDSSLASYGPNSRRMAIGTVKRALNWCVAQGYLRENPINGAKKPPKKRRGDEAYISPDQWTDIVEDVREHGSRNFLDYITTLYRTGCRPQEIRKVEARHLDHEKKLWVFPAEESKKGDMTGRCRIVHLTDEVYDICQRLAAKHPAGPLFRNDKGKQWSNDNVAAHFNRTRQRTGIKACAVYLRHTFITDALLADTNMAHLMVMVGHSDLTMITEVYNHLEAKRDTLKRSLANVNSGRSSECVADGRKKTA